MESSFGSPTMTIQSIYYDHSVPENTNEDITLGSLNSADRMIAEILSAIRALVPFPAQGHRRPDLTSRPLRFIVVREYI